MRTRLVSLLLVPALAGIGACDARLYRPVAPHRTAAGDLRVEVVSIRTIPPLTVDLRIEGDHGTALRHALLAPANAAPCREGMRQSALDVDGKRPWLRPIELEGAHDVRLTFPTLASYDLLQEPTVVDLVLAPGEDRCLRVALTGREEELAWTTTYHGYASEGLRVDMPVQSVGGVGVGWAYDIGFGGYAGPLRLGADAGVGSAACTRQCMGSSLGFFWLPVGISASSFLFDKNGFGIQLGAAYRWYFATIGARDASRSLTIQAPEVRLTFAGTLWEGPGLPSGARVAAYGLDLFFSNWRYRGPEGLESSFVIGLGLSGQAGF